MIEANSGLNIRLFKSCLLFFINLGVSIEVHSRRLDRDPVAVDFRREGKSTFFLKSLDIEVFV